MTRDEILAVKAKAELVSNHADMLAGVQPHDLIALCDLALAPLTREEAARELVEAWRLKAAQHRILACLPNATHVNHAAASAYDACEDDLAALFPSEPTR